MEGEAATEFQDWELLANSDSDLVNSPNSVGNSRNFQETEGESEGIFRLDHFSLGYVKPAVDGSEEGSFESDNPSWIDPGSETRFQRRNSGEFWPDSGSDRSDDKKLSDSDVKYELSFVESGKNDVGFEGVGGIKAKEGKFESVEGEVSTFGGKNELGFEEDVKSQLGLEGFGETQGKGEELVKLWSDSAGDDLSLGDAGKLHVGSGVSGETEGANISKEEEENSSVVVVGERKAGGEEEPKKVVWWKVPFIVLRYCVFRVSPVWSFSMAAAVMGFVILGRRLYKMKRKTKSLQLKVTVDDKKVSQFTSRAARLNEAFSVVRRVPIVRPLLPAAGGNPWPVVSLR